MMIRMRKQVKNYLGQDGRELAQRDEAVGIAEMALATGKPRLALARAEAVLAGDTSHLPAMEVAAKALWQMAESQRLLGLLRKMIEINPYEPGYFALRGAVEGSIGRLGDAIRSLERCLELSPEGNAGAAVMLHDIREYQAGLLATLLEEDPGFRIEFQRDPCAAALSRGFEINRPAQQVRFTTELQTPIFLSSRPS